jgi:hypothetical protein
MARTTQSQRRPVDLTALDGLAARMKLRQGVELPAGRSANVSVPRESFVPVVHAGVGSPSSVRAYRYRLLVPVAQTFYESPTSFRRFTIATDDDVTLIRETLSRHFGGVTMPHQEPTPALGIGARDPSDVAGTVEHNLHVAFEVYAAPVPESDEYFRALRRELQEALREGVILIERQEVTLV